MLLKVKVFVRFAQSERQMHRNWKTENGKQKFSADFVMTTCREYSKKCALDNTEILPVLIGPFLKAQQKKESCTT